MAVNLALIQTLLQQLPREEIEMLIKSTLQAGASKLDLVTHEQFALQQELVNSLIERINELENKVAELANNHSITN